MNRQTLDYCRPLLPTVVRICSELSRPTANFSFIFKLKGFNNFVLCYKLKIMNLETLWMC
jgi:hypothetical protein